jgi:hypothetical protein
LKFTRSYKKTKKNSCTGKIFCAIVAASVQIKDVENNEMQVKISEASQPFPFHIRRLMKTCHKFGMDNDMNSAVE